VSCEALASGAKKLKLKEFWSTILKSADKVTSVVHIEPQHFS
jgi:hypothetical protein